MVVVGVITFGVVVSVFWSLGTVVVAELSCGAVLLAGIVFFFFGLFVELVFNRPIEVSFLFSYLAPA